MSNPRADGLIESGRPLRELALAFPTKVSAYEYFAQSMTRRFASPDSHCVMCGQACEESPIGFTWRANLHTTKTVVLSFLITAVAVFAHHLYSRWVVVEFTTFHRLCPQCQRRHRTRGIVVSVWHKVLFAILVLLLCLTVPVVIFLAAMPFIAPEGIPVTLGLAVIGVGLLALVLLGFEACRKALIPHSLRQIGRFPFSIHAIHKKF
jgi:hypothetical protein